MPKKIESFQEILLELAEGATIQSCLIKRNITMWDFYTFLDESPENRVQYDKAMEIKSEAHAHEITHIADTDDNPAKARNRIETRKWLASKINPQRFGERLEINVTKTIDINAAIAEGRSRRLSTINRDVLPPRDLEKVIDAQVVETTSTNSNRSTGLKPDAHSKSNISAEEMPLENDDDDIFS